MGRKKVLLKVGFLIVPNMVIVHCISKVQQIVHR